MISQSKYHDLLVKSRLDNRNFEYMNHSLSWKAILEKLVVDFAIVDSFMMKGTNIPHVSYVDHMELRVVAKEMENMEVPSRD